MAVGIKDVFDGCRDYEKKRREQEEKDREKIRDLTWRVRNCSKKEAIIAQSQLKVKYGVRVLRPDEIKLLQEERKAARDSICLALEKFLDHREAELRNNGGVSRAQQELIDDLRADMRVLKGVAL